MKGKEIIDYVVRGEMPDLEQVREKCHKQAVSRDRENIARTRPRRRARWLRPVFVGAVCCMALVFGLMTFFPSPVALAVYAYGSDIEITREAVEISTGTLSDDGEMKGHLLQLYVVGEKVESIRFSCLNQYLEFNDRTEKQPFVGRVKDLEVSYKDVPASDYYYLRVDWIPWDTQRTLTENEEIVIADLDSSLREDVITLEVTFENSSTAKLIIHVQLDDSGKFTASLIDG